MRVLSTIIFCVIWTVIFGQVKSYNITNGSNLGIYPYKIYDSKDGHLLLSNVEVNVDEGYSNVLKVDPNGDTVFIKSTDAKDLFVSSSGNIITNAKHYEVLYDIFYQSYITMYDGNFNRKWQLDFSSSYAANSYESTSPPIVNSIYEINSNHFIASMCTYTSSIFFNYNMTPFKSYYIEFDSLGTISSNKLIDFYMTSNFFGKINGSVYSVISSVSNYQKDFISNYILSNDSIEYMDPNVSRIIDEVIYNDKIYMVGYNMFLSGQDVAKKAAIACMDLNGNVLWNKEFKPQDSLKNNLFTDLELVNNSLVCKYKEDTTEYILTFDTIGNLQHLVQYKLEKFKNFTNLLLYNNSVFTTQRETYPNIRLVKFDSLGYVSCLNNNSGTNIIQYVKPATFTSPVSKQISVNTSSVSYTTNTYLINTYTLALQDDCDLIVMIKEESANVARVYPNPTDGMLNVELGMLNGSAFIEVYNSMGQQVFKEKIANQHSSFDLHHLNEGIYFVKISYPNGMSVVKKVVVSR